MGLSGNLRTMDLPEILQWISIGRKTGTLHLNRQSIQKRIVFKEGVVYTSWSNDPRESLGQFLIRDGLVTEEQLFTALLDQEQQGRFLGAILVAEDILAEDELRAALRTKAVESIYDLFLWPEGQFEFKEGEFPELIHLDVPVTAVILEGVRRVDEWKRIRKIFPSANITFKIANPAYHSREPAERRALELVRAGKTLAEISLELRRSEFDAASLMFDLHRARRRRGRPDPRRDRGRRPGGGDQGPPGDRRPAVRGAALRRGARSLRGGPDARPPQPEREEGRAGGDGSARPRARAQHREARQGAGAAHRHSSTSPARTSIRRRASCSRASTGEWDVRSILKICPMSEESALLIFARLASRGIIDFVDIGDRR